MNDPKILAYSQELRKLKIEHKIVEHPDLRTPEEVQAFLKLTLEDGLSTLVMKTDEEFVVVIRRDDCRIDNDRLKKFLNIRRLRMATKEEFEQLTRVQAGAARVYIPNVKTFLDAKLFEKEFLTGGTGSFTCSFRYRSVDLKKIPNSTVADFSSLKDVSDSDKRHKQRVLSGIRATGRLHVGNYLGAVKGMLALSGAAGDKDEGGEGKYETLYMIADLHTTTTPFSPNELRKNRLEVTMDYLAAGLNPKESVIFAQSDLADLHTQLAFYFSTVVSVGRMQDLPTFKEKVRQYPKNVTMALLNYPVLMAADILIYKASLVPVGIDQEPHLEVTREIARRMNETYGTDFPEPKRFATSGEYVPSLTGEGKMSKTVEGSYINLTDDLETIAKKLAAVPTDQGTGSIKDIKGINNKIYIPRKSPISGQVVNVAPAGGVKTLLTFVEMFEGKEQREKYERQYQQYQSTGIRYQELKERLAEAIYRELEPIQRKRKELEEKSEYVEQVLRDGAARARIIAEKTISEVQEKMGLRPA